MRIIQLLVSSITPEICLGCGREGVVVCDDCAVVLTYPEQCISCKKLSLGGLTCAKCKSHTAVSALFVKSSYAGLGKDIVAHMKYRPSASTARLIGLAVSSLLPYLERGETVVSYVPTTPSRVRERGFDQAKSIASSLARAKGLHIAPLLHRLSKSHQVGLGRSERIASMEGAFTAKNQHLLAGKTIVLVDDVLTTGATIQSAAKVLKKAGASRVLAVVFARAE